MHPDIIHDLDRLGGLARVSQLATLGYGRRQRDYAIASGSIVRVCHGWLGTLRASRAAVAAVLHGGKLTGPTALASYAVWDELDRRIHVHVPESGHGITHRALTPLREFVPELYPREGVVRHWLTELCPDPWGVPWRVSVVDALICAAHQLSDEQFLACLESALHTRMLSRATLPEVFAALPRRFERLRPLIAAAESGLETLARLRFSEFVQDVGIQVWIDGIARGGGRGRVDILLDGWLVIELDGDDFHDPAEDRRRNGVLVRAGYRCHRFGYHDVISRWDEVEATVRELLQYPPADVRAVHRRAKQR